MKQTKPIDKTLSFAEKHTQGSILVDLGYRDYIAARCLLNNKLIIQGLTLASTAVEKYLKALIVFTSKKKENYYFHLDNIHKLKAILEKNDFDVSKHLDPVFLNILEKAFKIRYYDNLTSPITIGFYLNQFIGELDNTIHLIETSLIWEISTNGITPYKKAAQNKDPLLYENNFVLNNEQKKSFMEKPGTAFSVEIYISPTTQNEKTVIGHDVSIEYEGHLSIFRDFESTW